MSPRLLTVAGAFVVVAIALIAYKVGMLGYELSPRPAPDRWSVQTELKLTNPDDRTRISFLLPADGPGQRIYDVPARALPAHHDQRPTEPFGRWAVRQRVQAAGLLPLSDGPWWSMLSAVRTSDLPRTLCAEGALVEETPYSDQPYVTTRGFFQSGEANRLLGGEIPLACPVRLLHGEEDGDVPPEISLRLSAALTSTDVQVTLVKGGDHRLSRDTDIALLIDTVARLATS